MRPFTVISFLETSLNQQFNSYQYNTNPAEILINSLFDPTTGRNIYICLHVNQSKALVAILETEDTIGGNLKRPHKTTVYIVK